MKLCFIFQHPLQYRHETSRKNFINIIWVCCKSLNYVDRTVLKRFNLSWFRKYALGQLTHGKALTANRPRKGGVGATYIFPYNARLNFLNNSCDVTISLRIVTEHVTKHLFVNQLAKCPTCGVNYKYLDLGSVFKFIPQK